MFDAVNTGHDVWRSITVNRCQDVFDYTFSKLKYILETQLITFEPSCFRNTSDYT